MSTKLVMGLLLLVHTVYGDVIFSGYMRADTGSRFILTNTESNRSSGWLAEGASFEGYRITGFDSKEATLTVRKDDRVLTLPLKLSVTGQEKAENRNAAMVPQLVFQLAEDGSIVAPDAAKQVLYPLKGKTVMIRLKAAKGSEESKKAVAFMYLMQAEFDLKIVDLRVVKN